MYLLGICYKIKDKTTANNGGDGEGGIRGMGEGAMRQQGKVEDGG